MPKADKLTAIREACDLDCEFEEMAAWAYTEQYTPTPQLLFAALERARMLTGGRDRIDWFTLKARTCALPSS
jgi:hypothetical protein